MTNSIGGSSAAASAIYDCAIIVPVYNPTHGFASFIKTIALRAEEERYLLVVVNDGCDRSFDDVFETLKSYKAVRLYKHEVNMGKGAALKTGFTALIKSDIDLKGAITADADGQHCIDDIFAVLKAGKENESGLTLGVRKFDQNVPLRSKVGNTLTQLVFYGLTAINLADTQTGLRYIPRVFFQDICTIKSSGYAFEMEMLLWAKQSNVRLHTHDIKTIYFNENSGSHFRPFVDSVKIYSVLLKQGLSSVSTSVLDLLAFSLFFYICGGGLFLSNAFSRTVSFPVYYFLNRDYVFKQKALGFHPVPRLVLVIFISGLVSYFLQSSVIQLFGLPAVASKIVIETIMFLVNFVILRDFVFKGPRTKTETGEA
tara:strand:- start:154791 stop:155900 length:1110 start_codon:yes stop_codon:yes gene_type:complete